MLRPIDRWFIDEVLPLERRLLASAARLASDGDQARDLVQQTYEKLLERDNWASIGDVHRYATRVLRNLALSQMRRARVVQFSQLVAADADEHPDDRPNAFRIAAGRQDLDRLSAALADMPERCSVAVMRCRVDGETPVSVARSLGLSLSTLEKRLARGLHLLTTALRPALPVDVESQTGSDVGQTGHAGMAGVGDATYERRIARA